VLLPQCLTQSVVKPGCVAHVNRLCNRSFSFHDHIVRIAYLVSQLFSTKAHAVRVPEAAAIVCIDKQLWLQQLERGWRTVSSGLTSVY
jgi:hypothetical protein